MKLNLSLCMLVQNEEDCLERCLSSVVNIVSEIIVVDAGSTDQSQKIAKRYGASVVTVPWEDDFAKARNEGLKQATKEWILVLDADEELEEPNLSYLNHLLQQEEVYGYFVKMKNYVGHLSTGEYVTDSVCRLFRNHPEIRFIGSIHEEVSPVIQAIPGVRLEFADITVRHYGYLDEIIRRKKKNERNLRIIQGALKRHPDDLRLQYALGTEYFQREDYRNALAVFESILPRVPVFSGYDSDLFLKMAYAMRETGRHQDAEHAIEKALLFYPDFTDLLELKAMLLMDRENYQDAYLILLQAIELGDVSCQYTSSSGSGTYRSHYLAGLTCEYLYLWQEAKNHYLKALLSHPGYLSAWKRLAPISVLLQETGELVNFLAEYRDRIPETAWNLVIQTIRKDNTDKKQLPALYKTDPDALTYPEKLVAGMLAYNCGEYEGAFSWFSKACSQFPNRIAPFVGLLHCYVAKARSISGQPIDPPASDLRFLALCE
ncbi:tetratricopeptide repeat-containing glycosyltransferase family 2 protein [Effusibacillus lacus]|uniref:Glycosyl transferase family 2 n=1 Tax=Effusibacillus lacus TaxID=1348429 RepID=A0A292YT00_9BACL|nr:glycosyltransferase family 2 protein [Effusibacillus lacus]TCS74940.1 glycosyltransferase involved in cell wall biosynthesis [Effusibacillus lacus]GAX91610.1 glycosyl transferase family 2 [Effusibacillus lacus]